VPSMGNLIVSSKHALSTEDIKKKLIEICRQENKPYGYRVETLTAYSPRLRLSTAYVKPSFRVSDIPGGGTLVFNRFVTSLFAC
jgi:hypothetical protein